MLPAPAAVASCNMLLAVALSQLMLTLSQCDRLALSLFAFAFVRCLFRSLALLSLLCSWPMLAKLCAATYGLIWNSVTESPSQWVSLRLSLSHSHGYSRCLGWRRCLAPLQLIETL